MQMPACGWWLGCSGLVAVCVGCAHNHGNTYAYAPPYAPPVYPQPNVVAQPVSYAAPVAGPVVGQPGPAVAMPAVAGPASAGQATPCPEACPDGTVVGGPVVVEGGGQTPPCPPGP